jgi:hypothetical protein
MESRLTTTNFIGKIVEQGTGAFDVVEFEYSLEDLVFSSAAVTDRIVSLRRYYWGIDLQCQSVHL